MSQAAGQSPAEFEGREVLEAGFTREELQNLSRPDLVAILKQSCQIYEATRENFYLAQASLKKMEDEERKQAREH